MRKSTQEIMAESRRLCDLYIKYINGNGIKLNCEKSLSASKCCTRINREIRNHFKRNFESHQVKEEVENFIYSMERECLDDFVDDRELEWVLKDDIACMIMWCYLREYKGRVISLNNIYSRDVSSHDRDSYTYDLMGIDKFPIGTKNRYYCITEFIDNIKLRIHFKLKLINNARTAIYKLKSLNKKTSWIVEGERKSADWAWEYIVKNENVPDYFEPLNCKERYLSVFAFIFSTNHSDAERELLLIKMSNAWRQAQYRVSNSKNKLINTYISNDSKSKLDYLVSESGTTIKKMVENLINNEYDRMSK